MTVKFPRTNEELREAIGELKEQAKELKGTLTLSSLILLYMRGYRVEKIYQESRQKFQSEWLKKLAELQNLHKKGYEMGLVRKKITLIAGLEIVK